MPKRWLIRALFLLPILICMAAWVLSYYVTAGVQHSYADCRMLRGGIYFAQVGFPKPEPGWNFFCGYLPSDVHYAYEEGHLLGFSKQTVADWGWFVGVPFWFVTILSSTPLLLVWRKTRPRINPKMAFPVEVKSQSA